jgi:hypothetical protein
MQPPRAGGDLSTLRRPPSRSEWGDNRGGPRRRSGSIGAIVMSPLQSSAVSSQDCGSDRAERGNRTREIGRSRTSGRSCADASIRGDASARGRDQSDSQRMALVARRGSGRTGDRRCFCPEAAVWAVPARLLLLCLLLRSSWLTVEGDRQGRRRQSAASPGRTGSRGRVGRRGWWRSDPAVLVRLEPGRRDFRW